MSAEEAGINVALRRSVSDVFRALIADTFQEARARSLFWGLFALSTLLILIFLFVLKIDLVEGAISIMGIESTTRALNVRTFVLHSYSFIAIFLYIWGTLLAIFASSGLIPSVLEPGRIALLLSKPVTRPILIAGRYLGNVLVIALNHTYLVGAIWIIIGLKTHMWEPRFLLAIPTCLFMFCVLLCVVTFIGVVSESAALSVMVTVALMVVSAILAQRHLMMRVLSSEWTRDLWQSLYWVVPKFYDLATVMQQTVLFNRDLDWATPLWTSAVFGIAVLSSALYIFAKRDF
jgi:ABC-type transport system involved in multi-copper enzyme maturation permease subunit